MLPPGSNSIDRQAEFDGWTALERALSFLSIHLGIAIAVALAFFTILLLTQARSTLPRGFLEGLSFLVSEFLFVLTFAAFGVVTAFFLSLGLKRGESGESVNGLVETFAAPFISLLTAGIVFIGSRSEETARPARPARTAVSVTCFLVAAIISYRTFFYQILTAY